MAYVRTFSHLAQTIVDAVDGEEYPVAAQVSALPLWRLCLVIEVSSTFGSLSGCTLVKQNITGVVLHLMGTENRGSKFLNIVTHG